MSVLQVFREIGEATQFIGSVGETTSGIEFSYDEAYVEDATAAAVSSSLPLAGGGLAPAFFEGLLPEGARRGGCTLPLCISIQAIGFPFLVV